MCWKLEHEPSPQPVVGRCPPTNDNRMVEGPRRRPSRPISVEMSMGRTHVHKIEFLIFNHQCFSKSQKKIILVIVKRGGIFTPPP